MVTFKPFANEEDALSVGEMNIENRLDRVSLYGTLDITRDKAGLAAARELAEHLAAIVKELEGQELSEKVRVGEAVKMVKNPFG